MQKAYHCRECGSEYYGETHDFNGLFNETIDKRIYACGSKLVVKHNNNTGRFTHDFEQSDRCKPIKGSKTS